MALKGFIAVDFAKLLHNQTSGTFHINNLWLIIFICRFVHLARLANFLIHRLGHKFIDSNGLLVKTLGFKHVTKLLQQERVLQAVCKSIL